MHNSIQQFLRKGELSQLTQQALRLQKIQKILQEILPPELIVDCRAVSLTNSCLLLEVSNSSMATVLRYYTPTLLGQLRGQQEFASIASIKQQVKPKIAVPSTKAAPCPHHGYSAKTSNLLAQMADKIEYDPLKQALLKLAQHLTTLPK